MKKIIRIEQLDSTVLNLTWIINNICSNRCSYCPSTLHKGSNHNYDWKNAKIFLKELFSRYSKIRCNIAGGEPTMSPFLSELVDMIHEHDGIVTLTSNGSRTPEYWKEIAPKITWIGLSYHSEFSTDRYFENLNTVKMLTRTDARVMMLSKNWNHCVDVYDRLSKDNYHGTSAVRINNWLSSEEDNDSYLYTDEQLEWFKNLTTSTVNKYKHLTKDKLVFALTRAYMDDGSREIITDDSKYINSGQTSFKGYTCEIGIRSLYIDQYGDIMRGNCMAEGVIGNINAPNNIQWPERPVVCSYDSCICGTDVRINKWINE